MFDKLLDKATSPLLLEPDWETILQLCDVIKLHEVTPKYAVHSIKKKLRHENAHVILHSLQCLESMVKNCGGAIHKEIAQKDLIEALKELAKNGPDQIRDKVLGLIQCWSHGLGQQYKIFTETLNSLKLENYRFPLLKESEVMFENADVAPEWKDDQECFRCRQPFTTFTRKHHCRACGEVFCDKCSSKYSPLPNFGIDHDVRVCESCYEKLSTKVSPKPVKQKKNPIEIDEEESFQLALAISQSEAEEKERQKKILTQKYALSTIIPAPTDTSENHHDYAELNKSLADDLISDQEIDQFTITVIDHLNHLKFRMLSDQQRHRNITTDTAVQSAFLTLQHLHPELHHLIQLLENKRTYYENLQDQLNQLKDAREALNALRIEHYERKQQETIEHERQRPIQLAQKLHLMRQKKQKYQQQVHLQHLAQQEMEMNNHLEHQQQFTLAWEQFSQHPHLAMVSSHIPLPLQQSIDTNNQYQPSFYTSVMPYPSHAPTQSIFYPPNANEGNTYISPAGQMSLINSAIPYTQQS